jgi:flagellar assembly protein FliH
VQENQGQKQKQPVVQQDVRTQVAAAKESVRSEMQKKADSLQSQIKLLSSRLEEANQGYEQLAKHSHEMEQTLEEQQRKLDRESAALLSQAQEDAEAARADAAEKGHAEGMARGLADAMAQAREEVEREYKDKVRDLVQILETLQSKAEAGFSELVRLNGPRLLRLWQRVLEMMLHKEVALDSEAVFRVLNEILSRVSDKNRLIFYLAPSEAEVVQGRTDQFAELIRGAKHVEFVADASVEPGSCIVETNMGIYDARWKTQFEQIDLDVTDLLRQEMKDRMMDRAPAPGDSVEAEPVPGEPAEAKR